VRVLLAVLGHDGPPDQPVFLQFHEVVVVALPDRQTALRDLVRLPLWPDMSEEQVEWVARSVSEVLR